LTGQEESEREKKHKKEKKTKHKKDALDLIDEQMARRKRQFLQEGSPSGGDEGRSPDPVIAWAQNEKKKREEEDNKKLFKELF